MDTDNKFRYAQKKIGRVSGTFVRAPGETRQAVLVANTVDDARLYRLGYCQDGQEMRDLVFQVSVISYSYRFISFLIPLISSFNIAHWRSFISPLCLMANAS